MSCLKLNKNKIFKLFSAMPDLEMNPLLFKAFSPPTTSHEETSFQRIQPYASLRKSKPPVPPRLGTDPVKRRCGESGLLKDKSEPIYQVSVTYDASTQQAKIQNSWCVFETCPEKFFEPKETHSQIVRFCLFYNKISSNFALNFNFLLIHIKFWTL